MEPSRFTPFGKKTPTLTPGISNTSVGNENTPNTNDNMTSPTTPPTSRIASTGVAPTTPFTTNTNSQRNLNGSSSKKRSISQFFSDVPKTTAFNSSEMATPNRRPGPPPRRITKVEKTPGRVRPQPPSLNKSMESKDSQTEPEVPARRPVFPFSTHQNTLRQNTSSRSFHYFGEPTQIVPPSERKNLFGQRLPPLPPQAQSEPVPPTPMASASFPTGLVNPPNTASQLRDIKSFSGVSVAPSTPSAARQLPPLLPKSDFASKLRSKIVTAGKKIPRTFHKINERMAEREATRKLEIAKAKQTRGNPLESVEKARTMLEEIKAEREEEARMDYYRAKRLKEAEEAGEETRNRDRYTQGLAPSSFVEESTEADESDISEFDTGSEDEGSLNEQPEEAPPFNWASASYAPSATPAKQSTSSRGPKSPEVINLISDSEDADDEPAEKAPTIKKKVSFSTNSDEDDDTTQRMEEGILPHRDSSPVETSDDEDEELAEKAPTIKKKVSFSTNSDEDDDMTQRMEEGILPHRDSSPMETSDDDDDEESAEKAPTNKKKVSFAENWDQNDDTTLSMEESVFPRRDSSPVELSEEEESDSSRLEDSHIDEPGSSRVELSYNAEFDSSRVDLSDNAELDSSRVESDDDESNVSRDSIRSESFDVEPESYNHASGWPGYGDVSGSPVYDVSGYSDDSEDNETLREAEVYLPSMGSDSSLAFNMTEDVSEDFSQEEDEEESHYDEVESSNEESHNADTRQMLPREFLSYSDEEDLEEPPVASSTPLRKAVLEKESATVVEASVTATEVEPEEGDATRRLDQDNSVGHFTALDLSLFGPDGTLGGANQNEEDEESAKADTRQMLPREFVSDSDEEGHNQEKSPQQTMQTETTMDAQPSEQLTEEEPKEANEEESTRMNNDNTAGHFTALDLSLFGPNVTFGGSNQEESDEKFHNENDEEAHEEDTRQMLPREFVSDSDEEGHNQEKSPQQTMQTETTMDAQPSEQSTEEEPKEANEEESTRMNKDNTDENDEEFENENDEEAHEADTRQMLPREFVSDSDEEGRNQEKSPQQTMRMETTMDAQPSTQLTEEQPKAAVEDESMRMNKDSSLRRFIASVDHRLLGPHVTFGGDNPEDQNEASHKADTRQMLPREFLSDSDEGDLEEPPVASSTPLRKAVLEKESATVVEAPVTAIEVELEEPLRFDEVEEGDQTRRLVKDSSLGRFITALDNTLFGPDVTTGSANPEDQDEDSHKADTRQMLPREFLLDEDEDRSHKKSTQQTMETETTVDAQPFHENTDEEYNSEDVRTGSYYEDFGDIGSNLSEAEQKREQQRLEEDFEKETAAERVSSSGTEEVPQPKQTPVDDEELVDFEGSTMMSLPGYRYQERSRAPKAQTSMPMLEEAEEEEGEHDMRELSEYGDAATYVESNSSSEYEYEPDSFGEASIADDEVDEASKQMLMEMCLAKEAAPGEPQGPTAPEADGVIEETVNAVDSVTTVETETCEITERVDEDPTAPEADGVIEETVNAVDSVTTVETETCEITERVDEDPTAPEANGVIEETVNAVDSVATVETETCEITERVDEDPTAPEANGVIEETVNAVDSVTTVENETCEITERVDEDPTAPEANGVIEETVNAVDSVTTVETETCEITERVDEEERVHEEEPVNKEEPVNEEETAKEEECINEEHGSNEVETNEPVKEATEVDTEENVKVDTSEIVSKGLATPETSTAEAVDTDISVKEEPSEATGVASAPVYEGRVLRNRSITPITGPPVAKKRGAKRNVPPVEGDHVEEGAPSPPKKARVGRPRKMAPAKVEPPTEARNLRPRSTTPLVPAAVPVAAPAKRVAKRKAALVADGPAVEPRNLRSRSTTPFVPAGVPAAAPAKRAGKRKAAAMDGEQPVAEPRNLRSRSTTPFVAAGVAVAAPAKTPTKRKAPAKRTTKASSVAEAEEAAVEGGEEEEKPLPMAKGRPRKAPAKRALKASSVTEAEEAAVSGGEEEERTTATPAKARKVLHAWNQTHLPGRAEFLPSTRPYTSTAPIIGKYRTDAGPPKHQSETLRRTVVVVE
ncbi:hypothetical protein BZA05DRAFT_421913 [Tricharina praecox]|uniref:uncharacterized protein n=1 Tax=Tricharina praecox TaxID=43433 RepID=UPI00221FA588|nr:uncharacterized protein BZA05DRAFT_421913 [Tricharina praecox]KAI5844136.1 hypothetical protein BZA05DRAFT_421913 [Tricharina praecox]